MVLLHKKHQLFRKTHVRGYRGGTLLNYVPAIGTAASSLFSKIDYSNIAKTLGGLALGSLASYGVNKFLDNISDKSEKKIADVTHEVTPKLTVAPLPGDIIKDDILPVKNTIQQIDEKNHTISLNDGYVKTTNEIIPKTRSRANGAGMRKKRNKNNRGGNLNQLLNEKSKAILDNLLYTKHSGKGIYQI